MRREELMQSDILMTSKIIPYNWMENQTPLDMVIELLLMTGRSLPEVMMMVVPEA
jgi:glutamate synthase (ferredoxin)